MASNVPDGPWSQNRRFLHFLPHFTFCFSFLQLVSSTSGHIFPFMGTSSPSWAPLRNFTWDIMTLTSERPVQFPPERTSSNYASIQSGAACPTQVAPMGWAWLKATQNLPKHGMSAMQAPATKLSLPFEDKGDKAVVDARHVLRQVNSLEALRVNSDAINIISLLQSPYTTSRCIKSMSSWCPQH